MDKLELHYCCEVAANTGVSFTLYADYNYKNFYVDWGKLTESASKVNYKLSTLDMDLCDAVTNKTRRDIRAVNLESVKPRVTAEFFPTELFEFANQPFPKPIKIISEPRSIFHTNGNKTNPHIEIYRNGNYNVVCVGWLSNMLFGTTDFPPALVEQVMRYPIFKDNEFYYIGLCHVKRILRELGATDLLNRFNHQVFMELTPYEQTKIALHCVELTTVPYEEHELTIYKGAGFGENSFFFVPADLDDILDAHGGIKDMAEMSGTFLAEDGEVYCRLDMAGEIAKTWAAALWDGHNQNNRHIQGAFDFYRWFNKFMPIFIAENVQYTCDLVPFADGTGYEEPAEQPVSYDAFSPKKLIAALAGRLNFKHDDLVDAILELREDLFDEEQDALRSELYDTTDAT